MPNLPSDDLTKKLRIEVETAAKEYQAAKLEYNVLMAKSADLGDTHPDGGPAFRQAIRLKTSAFCKYVDALKRFNYVVIHHAEPPENQD
jgi:hypothetical protein